MASCHSCILGQVFGEFSVGLARLADVNSSTPQAPMYGFDVPVTEWRSNAYGLLRDEWLIEIAARLALKQQIPLEMPEPEPDPEPEPELVLALT